MSSALTFNWTALPSSPNLAWTPCYDSFQCTKFTVPLQYSDPSAGEAQLAIIMSPSSFSPDNPEYRGHLLLNPGGPGESGINYLLELEYYLRAIVGTGYDLVSFDPRGIGFSTPTLSLFADPAEANVYLATYPTDVSSEPDAFARQYAWGQVYSGIAMQKLQAGQKIWESVGTPAVAADMLAIARAYGSDVVNYWGLSYGTTIGTTFAATYPDNVGRIVLDGVMNGHEYYAGHDHSSLSRTLDALNSFYEGCVAAGPSYCAIWSPNVTTIRNRVDALLNSTHRTPLAAPPGMMNVTLGGVVDYTLLSTSLFETLYTPFTFGPPFASALHALEQGNPAPLFVLAYSSNTLDVELSLASGETTCDGSPANQPFQLSGGLDTRIPILCGDSAGRAMVDRERALEELEGLKALGGLFGNMWWSIFDGPCATWNITAKDLFNGSFSAKTKNPILFISNTFDPVTPIDSGRNMSSGFKGSVLLEQNSTGHSSFTAFSTCTALAIRSYFANGTLPQPNTICQTDTQLFIDPGNSSAASGITFPSSRALFDRGDFVTRDGKEKEFEEAVKTLRKAAGTLLTMKNPIRRIRQAKQRRWSGF